MLSEGTWLNVLANQRSCVRMHPGSDQYPCSATKSCCTDACSCATSVEGLLDMPVQQFGQLGRPITQVRPTYETGDLVITSAHPRPLFLVYIIYLLAKGECVQQGQRTIS